MKAYAILAACLFVIGAAPAQAFFHGGGHGPAPHFGGPGHGAPGPGFPGHGLPDHGFPGHGFPGHGFFGYGALDSILGSSDYTPRDDAAPEPRPEPQLIPIPIPVPIPVSAPQMRAPEGSGPRIIYLGHEPPRRDLPKVIYGAP